MKRLLLVIVAILLFSPSVKAQETPVYRFLTHSEHSVFILRCEAGVCVQESTITEDYYVVATSLSVRGDRVLVVAFGEYPKFDLLILALDGTLIASYSDIDFSGIPVYVTANDQWAILSSDPSLGSDCFINLSEDSACQYPYEVSPVGRPQMFRARLSLDGQNLLFWNEISAASLFGWGQPFYGVTLMPMTNLEEYAPIRTIAPGLLGWCDTFDWFSADEMLYHCRNDEGEDHWYITQIDTGEVRRTDIPLTWEFGWILRSNHQGRIAYTDCEQMLIWDGETVEEFSITADLDAWMNCGLEWLPQ